MQKPQLLMQRCHLKSIREVVMPKVYAVRTYRPGDETHWARIISRAFGTECSASVFPKEIAGHEAFRPERVFFLTYRGRPVGTATAWVNPQLGKSSGYVHMVAVVPEHTGKGLGKLLTTAVLTYFKQHGFQSAFLHTDADRLPAIRTYLHLGFEPVVPDEDSRRQWVEVFRALQRPELAHKYCGRE